LQAFLKSEDVHNRRALAQYFLIITQDLVFEKSLIKRFRFFFLNPFPGNKKLDKQMKKETK